MSEYSWNDKSNWLSPCCQMPPHTDESCEDGVSSLCSKCNEPFHYCEVLQTFSQYPPAGCRLQYGTKHKKQKLGCSLDHNDPHNLTFNDFNLSDGNYHFTCNQCNEIILKHNKVSCNDEHKLNEDFSRHFFGSVPVCDNSDPNNVTITPLQASDLHTRFSCNDCGELVVKHTYDDSVFIDTYRSLHAEEDRKNTEDFMRGFFCRVPEVVKKVCMRDHNDPRNVTINQIQASDYNMRYTCKECEQHVVKSITYHAQFIEEYKRLNRKLQSIIMTYDDGSTSVWGTTAQEWLDKINHSIVFSHIHGRSIDLPKPMEENPSVKLWKCGGVPLPSVLGPGVSPEKTE